MYLKYLKLPTSICCCESNLEYWKYALEKSIFSEFVIFMYMEKCKNKYTNKDFKLSVPKLFALNKILKKDIGPEYSGFFIISGKQKLDV